MSKPSAAPATKPSTKAPAAAQTTKVSVTLHGLEYLVACDTGEEKKLAELVALVNEKIEAVSTRSTGANTSEMRLFMLTCLLLADELLETRKAAIAGRKADEELMVAAVEHLRDRVNNIAQLVGRA